MSSITGATDIDAGVRFLRESAVPEIQHQRGFHGLLASGDRSTGTVHILTLWENEQDLTASESTASKVRQEALGVFGGKVTVEAFEQVVMDVGDTPPTDGCMVRTRRIKIDPTKADDQLAMFRSEVLPRMKAMPGFRAVRHLLDRRTGQGVVGTIWSDEASMKAADQASEQQRRDATSRGVEFGETGSGVTLFSHLQ
jgi:heme-degrading monooxygenase HmoA